MKSRVLFSLLAATILAANALSQQASEPTAPKAPREDKPLVATEIESVRLNVENDGENAYFHFIDSVRLNATNMVLECDSLEIFATREAEEKAQIGKYSAIREIIAKGNVKIVQEERTAICDLATIKPNEERIVITGAPARVLQTGGEITGDKIILNRANGQITFEGSNSRRIRLRGPAIGDLGFEQTKPVPTPEDRDSETADDETEQASEEESKEPAPDAIKKEPKEEKDK